MVSSVTRGSRTLRMVPRSPLRNAASLLLRRGLRWSKYTVSKKRWYPTGAQPQASSALAAPEEWMRGRYERR